MRLFHALFIPLAGLWIGIFCPLSAEEENLLLAENGRSAYRIVIAEDASPSIEHAAEELQAFLAQMTGARLPIVSDRERLIEREILIGDNTHLRQAGIVLDFSSLGTEGYHLKTAGPRLVIAGNPQRGALYGIYGLLEDHLGCRWFTPELSRIPQYNRLEIPPLDERRIPALEFREVFTFDCFDGDWCARNRVNSHAARLEAKHGGKMAVDSLAHTFNFLIPPQDHFDSHPEYFSLVKGKRLKDHSQLCCTNEEVIRLCTQATLDVMSAKPECRVFSVSQNDCFNYCECEKCQELAREEESQIAPVLALVNRVAEAVEREFPRNIVQTLAYQWTRKPPKRLRPRNNVVIQLCSIECCFSHPLAGCDSETNRKFREDLEAWSKTGARLWVWDYVTVFTHYLMPFPNQHVRRDNIRYFVQNGVKGIFEQDTYNTPHSELAALGGYLTAKFLWNPDYDETKAMNEFLAAYYGSAAGPIHDYLEMLQGRVQEDNIHVRVFDQVSSPHLADDLLLEADALWQEAEERASKDPASFRRIQISRLSVDYAIVERVRLEIAGKLPLNNDLKAIAVKRYEPYLKTLEKSGVTKLCEWAPLDWNRYCRELAVGLGIK